MKSSVQKPTTTQTWLVDCISTSGYYIILGGNLVICKSKKQDAIAKSNVEVDFRAMAQGIYEPLLAGKYYWWSRSEVEGDYKI